jgi:hypothetical protein
MNMGDEWQPDAILNRKLDQLKESMFDYIEKNIEKIDSSLPVFFGHVAATLDKSFPMISDALYDEFIDAITYKILNTTPNAPGAEYMEKVLRHAMGNKRRRGGRATLDIIAGLKLISSGNYTGATEYLVKYRNFDTAINTAIAYCYYRLSLQRGTSGQGQKVMRPNDMELRAREEMLALARAPPPVNRLKSLDIKESQLTLMFWFMMDLASEWFPSEPQFLMIALKKARRDGDIERRRRFIAIATEHFHDNRHFLMESYAFYIEQRNGSGAASIVKQMMQQFPDDRIPIYFGMKLAIIASQPDSYSSFRKLAILKEYPGYLLQMLDVTFQAMANRNNEAFICFEEVKAGSGKRNHYISALEYILRDALEGDEERAKRAKNTLFNSIDQYCMQVLGIQRD